MKGLNDVLVSLGIGGPEMADCVTLAALLRAMYDHDELAMSAQAANLTDRYCTASSYTSAVLAAEMLRVAPADRVAAALEYANPKHRVAIRTWETHTNLRSMRLPLSSVRSEIK